MTVAPAPLSAVISNYRRMLQTRFPLLVDGATGLARRGEEAVMVKTWAKNRRS